MVVREDYTKYSYYGCIKTDDYESPSEQCQPQGEFLSYSPKETRTLPNDYNDYKKAIGDYTLLNIEAIQATVKYMENGNEIIGYPISPAKYEVPGKGTFTEFNDAIKALLENAYGKDFKNLTESEFNNIVAKNKNKTYEIDYIYKYNGEKKTVINIRLDDKEETPTITANLSSESKKGYKIGITDISNVEWDNKKVTATLSQENINNNEITEYYCNGALCGTDGRATKGSITINYTNYKNKVTVYGITAKGTKSNSITYGIKTDNKGPSNPTATIYKKNDEVDACPTKSSTTKINDNTWRKGYSYVVASSSKDNLSKVTYYLTTSGQTKDVNNSQQDCRNVNTEGIVTIKYKACDEADNCSSDITKTIKQDRTKPTNIKSYIHVNGEDPIQVSSYNGSWTKHYTSWYGLSATDISGIDHYEFKSATNSTPRNLTDYHLYPLDGYNYANYDFNIRAVDNAGNTSDWSGHYIFRIDRTPPTIKVVQKMYKDKKCYGVTKTNEVIHFKFSVTDSHSGVRSNSVKAFFGDDTTGCDFNRYGISKSATDEIAFGKNCDVGNNNLGNTLSLGNYYVKVSAYDNAGNRTTKYFKSSDAVNATGYSLSNCSG